MRYFAHDAGRNRIMRAGLDAATLARHEANLVVSGYHVTVGSAATCAACGTIFMADPADVTGEESARKALADLVDTLGGGFHLDTRGPDYVDEDGTLFSDAEAARYEAVVEAVFAAAGADFDPYAAALDALRAMCYETEETK